MGALRAVRPGAFALAVAIGALAPAGAWAQLVPHRAVYDMSLERSDEKGVMTSFNGRMVVDVVAADCEGLATNTRYVFQSGSDSGAMLLTDLRTVQWEAADGSAFRFMTRRYDDLNLTEETDGKARHTAGSLDVELKVPDDRQVSFKGEVLFPAQHLNRLIDAARANQRMFAARLYEGADAGDRIYDTFAVIGRLRAGTGETPETLETAAQVLAGLDRWPVTISYFPGPDAPAEEREILGGEEVPVYAISSELFENGVSRRVVLDYGDFSLKGELTDLVFTPKPNCD